MTASPPDTQSLTVSHRSPMMAEGCGSPGAAQGGGHAPSGYSMQRLAKQAMRRTRPCATATATTYSAHLHAGPETGHSTLGHQLA